MFSQFTLSAWTSNDLELEELIWDDKLKVIREKEQGEQFYRTKVEGTISFTGYSFDTIAKSDLDSVFEVSMWENHRTGGKTRILSGYFHKTDVEFDYDNGIASTQIKIRDEYSSILDHIDDEIDVLSLGLPVNPLKIDKRAILQLYMLGDTKITNVVGNQSYEVDSISEAPSYNEYQVVNKQFSKIATYIVMEVDFFDDDLASPDQYLEGTYSGFLGDKIWRSDGEYYLADEGFWGDGSWSIYDKNGVRVRPTYADSDFRFEHISVLPEYSYNNIYLEGLDVSKVVGRSKTSAYTLFARILTDLSTSWLESDNRFTGSDPLNYRYVTEPPEPVVNRLLESFVWSNKKSPDPTKWGMASNGEYFTRPEVSASGIVIPVGWSRWYGLSFWIRLTDFSLITGLGVYDSEWTLPDSYPLFDVIQKMFNYWNIPVIIQDSSACSKFFSGDSSETSEIRALLPMHTRQSLYITPITNLEKTFYDTAARKMTLSLRDIFQMFKGCFNVYWDLKQDGVGNTLLRLEHRVFYELGLTYNSENQNIYRDISLLTQPLVQKPWSFGQNRATYDVSDLPSRYEFKWPTECTDVFDGFAIQVDNGYVASNPKEEISISRFFSDVDLVMSTPDAFSDDSVALLGSTDGEKVTRQQLGPLNGMPELPTFFTQNGYLSFLYLELTYHRVYLSGDRIHAEDFPGSDTAQKGSMIAQSVEKFRHQTVRIPSVFSFLTSGENIQTPLGVGIPQKISYELDSCIAEIELLQEN